MISWEEINRSIAGDYVALIHSASTEDPRHLVYRKHDLIRVFGEDVISGRYIGSNIGEGKRVAHLVSRNHDLIRVFGEFSRNINVGAKPFP